MIREGPTPIVPAVDDPAALDAAIAALEAQRATLGDAVVEAALGPLRERRAQLILRAGGEQRKLVTVVFSDLVDFTVLSQTLDAEDVRTIVNRYFQRWHTVIEAQGGVVEKFIGDAVMAVFGLYQAQEDDPERAVRAAVSMTGELAALNGELEDQYGLTLSMRVGVDTGEVVVSTLDERPGAEFVVVGEAVNRAARLQAAAPPGGVLISADTCRHVVGRFALERRAGLHLKGIDAPVDAFLVLAEGSRSFWPERHGVEGVATRTVGRALELRRLQDWFAEVVEERVWRTVTVVGDAGVGKSRLLFELDHWLAGLPDGVWVLRARASAANAIVPYRLLRELFANRFEISDSDPPALVADKWLAGMRTGNHEVTDHALIAAAWLGFEIGDDHASVAGMRHDPRGLSEIGATALEAFLAHAHRTGPTGARARGPALGRRGQPGLAGASGAAPRRGARVRGGHGQAGTAPGPAALGRGVGPPRPPGAGAVVTAAEPVAVAGDPAAGRRRAAGGGRLRGDARPRGTPSTPRSW